MADAGGPRTVIVSGASRGVGLAIAERLAAAGFRVIAIARAEGDLPAARARLATAAGPGELVFRPFDLSQVEDIGAFVRDLRGEFGAPFGLVNNAAVGFDGLLANMTLGRIEALVRLNTLSPIVLTKHVARAMMAAGGGRIVNISSIIASTGYNGLSVYGATKASLVGFTRSLARELGRLEITVNAVAPGFMTTEMTKTLAPEDRDRVARRAALQRLVTPDDVAASVLHLMSEAG
ncbi:MAG TPA: SDR family oxidoreductase, partial [Phenylobacterium sp.]|uniref:SDR family NAD(P)-dependent oxidoreductase n=1 Tax=Phenylobacterium sp. TaxID=1871053 RepID=UPI002B45C258